MPAIAAKIQHGRIQGDDRDDLDDRDDEELHALDDAIDDAARSVARGETIPAEEVLRMLDADE